MSVYLAGPLRPHNAAKLAALKLRRDSLAAQLSAVNDLARDASDAARDRRGAIGMTMHRAGYSPRGDLAGILADNAETAKLGQYLDLPRLRTEIRECLALQRRAEDLRAQADAMQKDLSPLTQFLDRCERWLKGEDVQ